MSPKKNLIEYLPVIGRKYRKREAINRVLKTPQTNIGVVNTHRVDPTNIGDFYCGPHHYFDELKGKSLDIFDYKREDKAVRDQWVKSIAENALIVGGGGLLNRPGFNLQMRLFERLADQGKKIVLWGVGHNAKSPSQYGKLGNYNIDVSKFGLVGTRDVGFAEHWVPCVSCMHPIFDEEAETKNEIGVIFHKKTLRDQNTVDKFKEFPSVANSDDFENVVQFIKETDTILTDSYHAMYWSMLLGKKVMVFPNSTKFYNFKYQPVIASFDDFRSKLGQVQSYSGLLEECREVNKDFAQKTFDYIGL